MFTAVLTALVFAAVPNTAKANDDTNNLRSGVEVKIAEAELDQSAVMAALDMNEGISADIELQADEAENSITDLEQTKDEASLDRQTAMKILDKAVAKLGAASKCIGK